MSNVSKSFEGLGNALNIIVGLAAVVGALFLSVPVDVAFPALLMAVGVFAFSTLSFHVDRFDASSLQPEDQDDAIYQQKFLLGFKRVVTVICPTVFAIILGSSVLWKQAPSMITRGAVEVMQDELARPSKREAVRYVAAPALAIVHPPREAGAPVIAPGPSAEALKSRREVVALPMRFVLVQVLGDSGEIFGGKAWGLFLMFVLLGVVFWVADRLNFRRYVRTPRRASA